jgi:predicted signal transduction protein with EAL and GGDEF domain
MQLAKCEEVQGYFFSRPMPAHEFTKVLHEPALILSEVTFPCDTSGALRNIA